MNLDLAVLGVVLFFFIWGLFTGAATQIARILGLIAAYAAAGPAGRFIGLPLAKALSTPLSLGTVIGTVAAFVLIYLLVHLLSTQLLRRVLDGGPESGRRGTDRVLGGLLGALKAAVVLYIALCAATFLESNVSVAGKRFTFTPKRSVLMPWVREYNLLELQQFDGVRDVAKAVKGAADPKFAARYRGDLDFINLMRDPRFKSLMAARAMKKAGDSKPADVRALLEDDDMVGLLHDSRAMERIENLARHITE